MNLIVNGQAGKNLPAHGSVLGHSNGNANGYLNGDTKANGATKSNGKLNAQANGGVKIN